MIGQTIFAHSLPDPDRTTWEPLASHSDDVAVLAARFAESFGWAEAARVAGLLHDAGKASTEFQGYISGERASGGDHSTAGARIAHDTYAGVVGRALAACIAGHHAGLADAGDLDARLDPAHSIPAHDNWAGLIEPLPGPAALRPTRKMAAGACDGFVESFLIRILFSCLVDADFLATEAFMSGDAVQRGGGAALPVLLDRLSARMDRFQRSGRATPVNALRAEVLEHAVAKACEPPGFFTLTVPTGGGKTLTSLRFALEHACIHDRSRVIHVAPFTAIIEQTAQVFRDAIGDADVLEHHASFDWEAAAHRLDGGDERDGLGRLRRAAENWDAPVVVTTAVQLFESLFASRTSACRKLHNLADAVIVLDEAQTLPNRLLLPCLAALDELRRNYGATIVLCTATQPALRTQDGALRDRDTGRTYGLDIPETRELAPRPAALFRALRRATAEVAAEPVADETIAERFAAVPQMLCIVNTRAHARALFDRIAALPGAAHLTTLMCPAHRREALAEQRVRLRDGLPVRLVATSLIEAGVDVSFPEVWRARAGLDSIAQAAGRCNREGELSPALGRVVVFTPTDDRMPRSLRAFQEAANSVISDHSDILSPEAVAAYFRELYFQKGIAALDAAAVDDRPGILPAIADRAGDWRFPFESIARAFRMIDETSDPVAVPWNAQAEALLDRLAATPKPLRDDLRALQSFVVGIPRAARDVWLQTGDILPVRPGLGDGLLRFRDARLYLPRTGIDLSNPEFRGAAENIL